MKEKELFCQQVLQPDDSVYSVQWLVLPQPVASQVTPSFLLERYLTFIRNHTFGMVRPTVLPGGIEFRLLFLPISLLSFAPPRQLTRNEARSADLEIVGGVLAQKGVLRAGVFSLIVADLHDGVRVSVQLSQFHPRLLGVASPSLPRRLLYRFTQAAVHKAATISFLVQLNEELTGEKVRPRVIAARVRVGKDI